MSPTLFDGEVTPDSTPSTVNVHNGTYTVENTATGAHVTVKLHTVLKGKLEGRRILSILIGPDNESSYTGVAFWDDDAKAAQVWKRHRGMRSRYRVDGYHWDNDGWSATEKKLAIWACLAVRGENCAFYQRGYRLHLEGRCVKCNRKLTTPESIKTGIGPVCAGRS